MKKEYITAWVTKYALTEGILKVDACVEHHISSSMITYGQHSTAHGKDWYRSPEEAIKKANEMRDANIKSLRNSIEKISKLTFEEKP